MALRDRSKEVRGEPGYYRSFCKTNKKQADRPSEDYCSLKKNIHLKLVNLALFYVWEDARVWAQWNHSFDMYLSYPGPVSYILISWVSSGLTGSHWRAVGADDWCVRKYSISQILSSWSGFWPILGDISWSNLSHGAGRLIPDQGEILHMSLQVLIFGLGPIDNERFSGSSV